MPRQYSVSFTAATVSAAQDLFEVVSAAAGTVELCGLVVGQISDYGDSAAEGLQLTIVRGHTTSGSGGAAATPVPMNASDPAATTVCEVNNTTIASAGTAVTLHAEGYNVQSGTQIWWIPEARPTVRNGERIVVRQSAPADALTMSGTLYLQEE